MLDINKLPSDVRDKLAELDLELSEGDITDKGYAKKRAKLLAPFISNLTDHHNSINLSATKNEKEIHHISRSTVNEHNQRNQFQNINNYGVYAQAGTPTNSQLLNQNNISSPHTRANRRANRKVTRHESRYHSEVRKEAVQQALASMKNKPKPALPMPSKRNSMLSNVRSKDIRNKYSNNLRSRRAHRSLLHSSSGNGTAGDSDTDSTDDYDDEEDEDLIVNNESSGNTPELNLRKLTIGKNISMPNSSSEECASTASSSQEQIISKHLKKQQQPLPLPPKVVAVKESHSANSYNNRNSHEYRNHHKNHHKSSSSNNQKTQLFQLSNGNKYHHSSKSSNSNNVTANYSISSPINNGNKVIVNNNNFDSDKPPALPQHKTTNYHHNQQTTDQQLFNDNLPECVPKRSHSKQHQSNSNNETSVLKTSENLIDLHQQHSSIESDQNLNSLTSTNNQNDLNTLMSNSSNNSSSNNNTSLISGAIDEPSTNNQNNRQSLDLSNSIDNLPPEYDQVYGDHLNQRNQSPSSRSRISNDTMNSTGKYKISTKIQQLLNTLKRPKKRPLNEFYRDYDDSDIIQVVDSNGPTPEGSTMSPIIGEQLQIPSGLPKTLESAIQRYGTATFKTSAVTVLDTTGKHLPTLTYGKLLSRSRKISYNLLNKVGQKRGISGDLMPIKAGDRVALIFPNNDPIGFICAFYGCLQAGVVPVPVEVPISRRDSGSLQIGFLLGSCNVNYALTSEACYKGLPKTPTGEIHVFKGWPKLSWLVPDNWSKPPKDWCENWNKMMSSNQNFSPESIAYIEYSMKEGSMKGVSVTRNAMISHCKALTNACSYTEGDVMVCLLDFKREVGLWHSILTSILNGIHCIFIPYALMKVNPSCWLQIITKYKASTAICKSRDLHWGLLSAKDQKDINLSSLRNLIISDSINCWCLSTCDQFLNVFGSKGLKPEALCPTASSTEAMTVSIRRPSRTSIGSTGRGVLSMHSLTYGVIRVDQENSLTSLTLQDCGTILADTKAAVVKIHGPAYRCKTDEVGEICISNFANECFYFGLKGLSQNQFKMEILNNDGTVYGDQKYVRSGLLGFSGPGGLIFITGTRDGLIECNGRKHNTDDLIATVLAVEPMKFVYRGRISVFSIKVLKDQRICVIAEQRPDCTEEESFTWMSKVLQAIDSIHQVGIYCLALCPPNYLPKTPLGGINLPEIKRRFLEGNLHPINLLMCPHSVITNLPKPREASSVMVGPASVMVGNIVQGNRLAVAQGRELGPANDDPSILLGDKDGDFSTSNKCQYIAEILKWRSNVMADHVLFSVMNSKGLEQTTLTCSQLHKRAERIACLLIEKGKINTGEHVALVYPPGLDLICAFYACLYVGAVPVCLRAPTATNIQNSLPTVKMIVDLSKSVLILSNSATIKILKSKDAASIIDLKNWIPILDTEDVTKKKFNALYKAPTSEMICYLDFSISTTGLLAGVKISHSSVTSLCKSIKLACELYPSRHIALCLENIYSGLGFVLWCLSSIYSGHHSILIPPSEVELNPSLWLSTLSQFKVRDTFCSYGIMELCTKELSKNIDSLKSRGIDLTCVRTCVVVGEERPRVALTNSFSKLFSSLGLSNRAVSTSFGCRVNVGICLQGASSPDLQTVYVDMRALRHDRVTLVEKGAPYSLPLIESGKLLPGVSVIIANPDTKGHLGDSNLGEIWVQSTFNSSGYICVGDEEKNFENNEKFFAARLSTGDTSAVYARTGYLGFLRRTESTEPDGEQHDSIYIVGQLDETIMLRGMRYHPIDIENSILKCHKKIAECAIFTWANLLVVVAELNGSDNEALDLVPLITNVVLEDHQVIVGVVVIVDLDTIESSQGEKQRMLLRDQFLKDKLNPIYVNYNN